MVKYVRAGQTTNGSVIRGVRIARWVTEATHTHTHTHSEHVIFLAFQLQQWLRQRASVRL